MWFDVRSGQKQTCDESAGSPLYPRRRNSLGSNAISQRRVIVNDLGCSECECTIEQSVVPALNLAPVERSPVFFESTAEALKEGKKALAHFLAKQQAA